MRFGSILLLSFGLAMDATAASAARGLVTPRLGAKHYALVAVFFGGSQALMPVLGWGIGARLGPAVRGWGAWIAFGVLTALGAKMLWEARPSKTEENDDGELPATGDPFALRTLSALAVATSIDAFAVGVTLPMLHAPFALSLATIGVTTALLSALGLYLGRRFGDVFGHRLDALGGLVLVALGVKALVEHLRR